MQNENAEHLANFELLRQAAESVGGDGMIWCNRIAMYNRGAIVLTWRVQVIMPNLPAAIYSGEGETVEAAIAQCLENIRRASNICKVCGGRMDGPCKHVH